MRFRVARNKTLSILLVIVMLMTLCPLKTFAAAPTFDGTVTVDALDANYMRAVVYFSEGVYTDLIAGAGSGAISKDDFTVSVVSNGGAVSSANIDFINASSNIPPQGGEKGFFFFLNIVGGPPSGTETVTIRPASDTAIYNSVGEAMASTNEVTFNLHSLAAQSFVEGYPKLGAPQTVGSKKVVVLAKVALEGVLNYVVLPDKATAPTAQQIKDHADMDGQPVISWAGQMIGAGSEVPITLSSNLDHNTDYDLYLVAEAGNNNFSEVKMLDIKTPPETVTVINLAAIAGVTAPATDEVPVTAITETEQYTGNISWSPSVSGSFAAETAYTATIILTPKAGYTLTGISANFFMVAGAITVSNPIDSGIITAVFPATAPATGTNDPVGTIGTAVWHKRAPLPSPDFMQDVRYLNGRYMAVGERGTLLTSLDGESWQKIIVGQGIDLLNGIAYGNGKYVLVGQVEYFAARIFTSDNGTDWRETAAVPSHTLNDVVYGNGKFVAIGSAGKIVTSSDGETWTTHTMTYPENKETTLLSITFAADKKLFVAAGMGSTTSQHKGGIMTSPDGINWTVTYSDPTYTVWDVTYGNNLFVAVGGTNSGSCFIATSGDGTAWAKAPGASGSLRSVEWDGSRFIATGYIRSSNTYGITTVSSNGTNWNDYPQSEMPSINAVASNGAGRLAAMCGRGNIYISDDNGISWTYRTLGTTKTLNDIAYNGSNLYVAVGFGGTIQTSADGQTWTIRSSGTTENLNKVDYLNNQFVVVGKNGTILTSSDGATWIPRTSGTTAELKGLSYGGGRYVVVGGGAVLYSMNGIDWISATGSEPFVSVAYGDGVFIAVMQYGQAYKYQVDPDTSEFARTQIASLGSSGCYPTDIIYGGGQFAAVGGYGEVYLSSNKGTSWTLLETDLDSYSWGIAYGAGNLIAVGEMGKIMASADGGATWYLQPSGLTINPYAGSDQFIRLNGVTAGNNCFVAVGENGLVLQSASFTVSVDANANDVDVAARALYPGYIVTGSNSQGAIVQNMNLFTTWNRETTVSWASSKPQYIATDGKVIRPAFGAGDQVVRLTATISKGSASDVKTFIVVVREAENPDIADVNAAAAALTFDTIKSGNSATNNITSNLNLITTGMNGTAISWSSNNTTYITTSGVVTRPAQGTPDQSVTLTATITKGAVSTTRNFYLTVKAQIDPDIQSVEDAKAALIFDTIKESNSAANNITSNLSLTTTGISGTTISWASSNTNYITTTGMVTRPAQETGDQSVTLTATITKGTASATKTFTLTVKAQMNTDNQSVAEATAALTFDTIKASNSAENNILSNLNLITTGISGTTISWSSSNSAYITAVGVVTRPPQGAANQSVTLTATITKGTASATKTFTLTVIATYSYSGGDEGNSTPIPPPAPEPKPTAQVLDSNGNISKSIIIKLDNSVGIATVEIDAAALTTAFDKSKTDENGVKTIEVSIPKIDGTKVYEPILPISFLASGDTKKVVEIKTSIASATVPGNMLTKENAAGAQNASITIAAVDKNKLDKAVQVQIGDKPIIELSLKIGGKEISWNNENAPVIVAIPYKPTAEELKNPESIVIWYVDGSGKAVSVPNGHYDSATESVTFATTHFSNYSVGYKKVNYKDVAASTWYNKVVSFLAAREITTGTEGDYFNPEAKLTRGDFIVMLMKAYEIAPDAEPKNNFADAGAAYYTDYLSAAKRLSISSGVGNNMFAPNREITRQEMFTLLYKALKAIGQLPEETAGKPLSAYTDANSISSWAKDAMTFMVKTGTANGSGDKLFPTNTTTRAEMAQVLYNLLTK